ncbi:MAG: hypothetical protein WBE71_17625 [Xanthobacteraceae bacterium]
MGDRTREQGRFFPGLLGRQSAMAPYGDALGGRPASTLAILQDVDFAPARGDFQAEAFQFCISRELINALRVKSVNRAFRDLAQHSSAVQQSHSNHTSGNQRQDLIKLMSYLRGFSH